MHLYAVNVVCLLFINSKTNIMNEQIQAMLDRLGKEGGIIMSSHECSNL